MRINGSVLTEKGFTEGHISVENGKISEIDENLVPYPDMSGIVIPWMYNHHTHIGDSFVRNAPRLPIKELVGPGGYKERALSEAPDDIILAGMERSIEAMISAGTSGFTDFREGGIKGVKLLKEALKGKNIRATILSRPVKGSEEEIEELLDMSDGFGLSSLSDYDRGFLEELSERAHRRKKIFSIHFSERVREDVDALLSLGPDMIIHAIEVEEEDMEAIADARIPVVLCPRSSAFFGKKVRLRELMEHGIDVRFGTDNGMIADPDVRKELKYLYNSARSSEKGTILRAVRGIFGRKALKGDDIGLREGQDADFIVVKMPWKYPEKGIITAEDSNITIFSKGSEING